MHGVLHLLGYDHAEPAQEREMFRLQNELLDTWRAARAGRRREARVAATAAAGHRRARRHLTADPHDAVNPLLFVIAARSSRSRVCSRPPTRRSLVSPARLEEVAREGRPGARALAAVIADRPRHANLLLLLRPAAEITATVMVTVALVWLDLPVLGGVSPVAVMVVVNYVVIGVGPRTIGRQHPYTRRMPLAGRPGAGHAVARDQLLILISNAITPGQGFREGPFSSDIELRELVDIAGSRGVVEETEREMIHSVFDLGDTIVREVMVPRPTGVDRAGQVGARGVPGHPVRVLADPGDR